MTSRRAEVALVAFLMAGCVGAIIFIFTTMTGPGGDFARTTDRDAAADAPAPPPGAREYRHVTGPPDVADLPDPEPESTPPEDEPPKEEPAVAEPKAPEEGAPESALLTIELLVPADEPDRVVEVLVRDESGEPIEDALVVFRSGAALLYRERTDIAGEAGYLPYESERGPFRVDAIAHGFVAGTARSVAPGATTEIVLKARPIVEGVVSAPAQGKGFVKLFQEDTVRTTAINEDGSFLFEDLEEGDVTVQAEVPPYGTDSTSFYLEGGTSRFVKLRVRKGRRLRIYGVIRFWPGKGTAKINGIKVAVTPSGSYEFERAVIGVNEIEIDAPGKALVNARFSVKGKAMSRYDFSLSREGKIKGRVRDGRTKRPVPDAVVRLGVAFDDEKNDRVPLFPVTKVPVVKTDRDGRFEVTRLDKRLIYLLSVVAQGRGQALVEGVVPDGGIRTVVLPEGPFLFGKLSARGGVPKDATLTALRLEETPSSRRFNVKNYDGGHSGRDRKGLYGLAGLLPGTYLVTVRADGYASLETVIDLTDGLRRRIDLRMSRFNKGEDPDARLLRRLPPSIDEAPEDLAPDDTTLLRVDARPPVDRPPFPGIRVSFWERDEEFAPPMEFTESVFELAGLYEGSYRAILTHPSLAKPIAIDKVVVKRGDPVTIVLR